MCEEFETHQDRSEDFDVLFGQSIVLSEIKAEVPLQNENPSTKNESKSVSQESKVSKFCMDAGFVHVIEVGQFFMTKDIGDFRQFRAENKLFHKMMNYHNQEDFKETRELDLYWKSRPVICMVNMN